MVKKKFRNFLISKENSVDFMGRSASPILRSKSFPTNNLI
jgi:hypothetical protein